MSSPRWAFFGLLVTLSTYTTGASAEGYHLPSSGTASTTQFFLGPEMNGGTSCGVNGWANHAYSGNPSAGQGPGFLYAAINQRAFGANPSAPNGGGPGGACGHCYEITPTAGSGASLDSQALTFMIVDECPASQKLDGTPNPHCSMCAAGEVNDFGQPWHFDIAVDAMNPEQYAKFYKDATDGSNWNAVSFKEVSCSAETSPTPPVTSWGCMEKCSNNEAAGVCLTSTAQDDIVASAAEGKTVDAKETTSGSKPDSVCSA